MECRAVTGRLHAHIATECVNWARISPVRIGVKSKQSAVKSRRFIVRASQSGSEYASFPSPPLSLYEVLCVGEDVREGDIKSAYRRMALRYHPDVCPPSQKEECTIMFLQIQEAYHTLSDPTLRQDYDWRLQNLFHLKHSEGSLESHVWEAQLAELIRRRSSSENSSWGSRMRRRNQQAGAAMRRECAVYT